MSVSISSEEFQLMQKFINDRCGILITADKSYLIESRLLKLVLECGVKNFSGLFKIIQKDARIAQKVIDAITTHETQWFRDRTPWNILEDILLPRYIYQLRDGSRREIKIWSAACSSGQEPYSTAICIKSYLTKNRISDVSMAHFKIMATDISEEVLATARAGTYGGISMFRGLDRDYLENYFEKKGNYWAICNSLKDSVEFRRLNLADKYSSAGQFDIVFCRYVMIYFDEAAKRTALKKVSSSLYPGGVMFLGNSEILNIDAEKFEQLHYNTGTYFRIRR